MTTSCLYLIRGRCKLKGESLILFLLLPLPCRSALCSLSATLLSSL